MITEIILTVLTKHDLSDEEKESRDEFLAILEEHAADTSGHVRARVFQHWARLQSGNAVPRKLQHPVLERAVAHLRDRGALVRKAAAACVTAFLTHNTYGARLRRGEMLEELRRKEEAGAGLREALPGGIEERRIGEVEGRWAEREEEIRAAIQEVLDGRLRFWRCC